MESFAELGCVAFPNALDVEVDGAGDLIGVLGCDGHLGLLVSGWHDPSRAEGTVGDITEDRPNAVIGSSP